MPDFWASFWWEFKIRMVCALVAVGLITLLEYWRERS